MPVLDKQRSDRSGQSYELHAFFIVPRGRQRLVSCVSSLHTGGAGPRACWTLQGAPGVEVGGGGENITGACWFPLCLSAEPKWPLAGSPSEGQLTWSS